MFRLYNYIQLSFLGGAPALPLKLPHGHLFTPAGGTCIYSISHHFTTSATESTKKCTAQQISPTRPTMPTRSPCLLCALSVHCSGIDHKANWHPAITGKLESRATADSLTRFCSRLEVDKLWAQKDSLLSRRARKEKLAVRIRQGRLCHFVVRTASLGNFDGKAECIHLVN